MPGTESGDRDGAAGDSDGEAFPAGAMFDEHQDGQALEQHGAGVQEAGGEDPGSLGAQELPPRRA